MQTLDKDEAQELFGALLELRGIFRKLQWFGEVNRRGFLKITKKLDKKMPGSPIQARYLSTKVDPKPFAKDEAIAKILFEINKWLALAGEAQSSDDDSQSDRSSRSLGRVSSKAMLNVPRLALNGLDTAIKNDDAALLASKLKEGNLTSSDLPTQTFLLNLLQRGISSRSKACIAVLLKYVHTLEDLDDINHRNCIHRLVLHIGRSRGSANQAVAPSTAPSPCGFLLPATSDVLAVAPSLEDKGGSDKALEILRYILDSLLHDHQRKALIARDALARFPIHYAAQYGCTEVCEILQLCMSEWGLLNTLGGIDSASWQDKDGHAPIHLAVLGNHSLCARALLRCPSDNPGAMDAQGSQTGYVLAIATKADSRDLLQLLLEAGANPNWTDESGETALHVAARFGHCECCQILIDGGAKVEVTEYAYGWTPLHVAAVDGHLDLVKLLVKAGATVLRPDSSGWYPKEHAALRGHLRVAHYLDSLMEHSKSSDALVQEIPPATTTSSSSLEDRRSKVVPSLAAPTTEPLKTFGHQYLKDQALVLVSLGTMDMRKKLDAVELDHIPVASAHATYLDTALSLVVSASGATGPPTTINLPVHENISTDPIAFYTSDPKNVRLFFDVVPTYAAGDSSKNKVARAVALLNSVRRNMGSLHGERSSLVGDVSVPLLEIRDLEIVGIVHFNFLVVTPFKHPKMEVTSQHTYWKKSISSTTEPMVIGHRGLGKNLAGSKSLQLGENTVESFIAAANLGANYVEFDVQLTKDHVPVIYHDFFVAETGIDAPVHTVTLEQFMHMSDAAVGSQLNGPATQEGPGSIYSKAQKIRRTNSPGPRSRSFSSGIPGTSESPSPADERMKHTRAFKTKGFKANSRGNFIQAPFATLEQLFEQVPEETGFNIECKYPMLHESQEHEMDAYAVELNSFVDSVLGVVYGKMGSRHVIFSSFNPDICLLLSFKQPSIPVLFLTDGTSDDADTKIGDIRASSLQEAIRFANRWNLLGVVSHAEPLVLAPRLVKAVKSVGLMCVSYGVLNNDSKMVQVSMLHDRLVCIITDSLPAPSRTGN